MSDADIEVSVEQEEEEQQETQGEPESTQDAQPSTSQTAKGRKVSKRAAATRPGPGSVKAGAIAGTVNFTWYSPFVLSMLPSSTIACRQHHHSGCRGLCKVLKLIKYQT